MTTKNVKHILGNGEEQEYIRLYADEGKALTNDGGETVWNCIDVLSADGWTEIDAPEPEKEPTEEEKAEAYDIIVSGITEKKTPKPLEIAKKIKEIVDKYYKG